MKNEEFHLSIIPPLAIVIAMLILASTVVASEPKETVLHHFGTGTDGAAAYGRLIPDAAGDLYGTTAFGGTSGAGIVFELANPEAPAGWTESILYNFSGGGDGSQPFGGLIFDSAGPGTCMAPPTNAPDKFSLTETITTTRGSDDGTGQIQPQGLPSYSRVRSNTRGDNGKSAAMGRRWCPIRLRR